MVRNVLAHLRAQWMGALALLIAIGTGSAYAANTIGTTDIINGQVKSPDIGTGQVQAIDVKNEGLTGAEIADQSGVDTCVSTTRLGSLCVRAENFARTWNQARAHCANLDLRTPSLGEALQLAQTHDIPNVDENESFWTDEIVNDGAGVSAAVINDAGADALLGSGGSAETVCVMTPTN
jgi:hypothetical protein